MYSQVAMFQGINQDKHGGHLNTWFVLYWLCNQVKFVVSGGHTDVWTWELEHHSKAVSGTWFKLKKVITNKVVLHRKECISFHLFSQLPNFLSTDNNRENNRRGYNDPYCPCIDILLPSNWHDDVISKRIALLNWCYCG